MSNRLVAAVNNRISTSCDQCESTLEWNEKLLKHVTKKTNKKDMTDKIIPNIKIEKLIDWEEILKDIKIEHQRFHFI